MGVGGGENVGEWAVPATKEGFRGWGGDCGREATMGCCGEPMADSERGYARSNTPA